MAFLLYGAAWVLARSMSGQSRSALFVIIAGALLFRITLLDIGINSCSNAGEMLSAVRSDLQGESLGYRRFVLFDDDVWRYLWDGHVSAAGLNPYQFPPNAPELDGLSRPESPSRLWTEIRARVNHPDLSTVYPPLAQLVFRFACWVAPGSVLAFKCIACLLDLIAAIFIALTLRALKYPVTSVVLYAWNPLVLTMIAGSGHIDALVAATIAATAYFVVRKNREMAAICFALSVLGKIAPIILIFLMMRRLRWKGTLLAVLVLIGMYLPYSSGGVAWRSLVFFAYTWQFNSGWFHLMERLMSFLSSDPSYAARIVSGVIILALAIRLALRDKGTVESFLSAA
ncbi:MAG TPA: glycosyltransferase family 87 protein, partial [Candidatus Sulfotelmatobacter sp.]|nr:glycosyltransferase family 87 protein [Candidatus Sulfotelmatobacter sp.]